MNRQRRDPEPLGIVPIHGAAVIIKEHALVFLGPSGAGKTTISKIFEPFAPVIGDDRLYLIPRGPDWFVADALLRSFEGTLTEEEARNLDGIPLKSIFRLYKTPEPQICPVDARQTCRYLSSAFYEFYWSRDFDAQARRTIFAQVAGIARKIPGFDLHFRRSTEIISEICNVID